MIKVLESKKWEGPGTFKKAFVLAWIVSLSIFPIYYMFETVDFAALFGVGELRFFTPSFKGIFFFVTAVQLIIVFGSSHWNPFNPLPPLHDLLESSRIRGGFLGALFSMVIVFILAKYAFNLV